MSMRKKPPRLSKEEIDSRVEAAGLDEVRNEVERFKTMNENLTINSELHKQKTFCKQPQY